MTTTRSFVLAAPVVSLPALPTAATRGEAARAAAVRSDFNGALARSGASIRSGVDSARGVRLDDAKAGCALTVSCGAVSTNCPESQAPLAPQVRQVRDAFGTTAVVRDRPVSVAAALSDGRPETEELTEGLREGEKER